MNIKLLSDKILVEVDENETKTSSGMIVVRSTEPNEIKIGKVVSVGIGKNVEGIGFCACEVKIGDRIMFQYGTPVMIEGKKYILLTESNDVLVILN